MDPIRKFIVTEIQTFANGTVATQSFTFDDRISAEAKYHALLATAAQSTLPTHAVAMYLNSGKPVRNEWYDTEQEEEQEETPETNE